MHYPIIIIGSGAAGLTAAVYAARANLKPLVITGLEPGGQLTTTTDVENFPGFEDGIMGPDLMAHIQAQAERFGAEIVYDTVSEMNLDRKVKSIVTDMGEYTCDALIVATGARPRLLDVPGEKELWAHGVSSCATCDGFFYKDVEVIVVGGGDSAMEEATFLTRFASRVHIVHRSDQYRASKIMLERAQANEKIVWHPHQRVAQVLGSDQMTGAILEDTRTGEQSTLDCDGLFLAIGHIPNTDFLQGQLPTDGTGYILTKADSTKTDIPGVFACGDVQDHVYRQAITAAGSGCMAALDAQHYLSS